MLIDDRLKTSYNVNYNAKFPKHKNIYYSQGAFIFKLTHELKWKKHYWNQMHHQK